MATKCPTCNRKLTLLDWKQSCPSCGTNLMFHGFEERFYEDAKYSELGRARVRVWWARVLSNLFGGKKQIIRLVFILLPVAALLLPFCSLRIELPLYSSEISLSLLKAVSAFGDGTISTVLAVAGAELVGDVASALAACFAALLGAAVASVLIVVFEILCFLNTRVMSALICASSVLGAGFAVFAVFAVKRLSDAAGGFDTLFSCSGSFGHYVLLAAFAAVFVPNVILAKKGIEVKYAEGDLYRIEVAKKLRRGEIQLSDLPQPIFETEQERLERERAIEHTINGGSPDGDEKAQREQEPAKG